MVKQSASHSDCVKIQSSRGDKALIACFYVFNALFASICLLPFLMVVSASFTKEKALLEFGYKLWPTVFSLDAYRMLKESANLFQSYAVTIFITVVGTALSMLFTCSIAYALSVKSFRSRSFISLFVYFTMLFSGGMVPTYLLITKTLKLQNTIWVLIIPSLCSAWNILLMRNFFNGISPSLAESAKLDGANDITIMFRIILPISLPGIATISLFYALNYWNEWMHCLLYIDSNHEQLYTLQYLLQRMLREVNFMKTHGASVAGLSAAELPAYTNRMATVVVAVGPIILLYPMLQKYFVQGLSIGAVKG